MSLTFEDFTTSNLSSNLSSKEMTTSNLSSTEMTNTAIAHWTTAYAHAIAIVYILFGVLGVASNGIVFFSVVTRPKLRTIDNFLLANVALIQLLYFATSHPISIWAALSYGVWRDDDVVCQISAYFNTTLLPVWWIAHAVLSVEKCIKTMYDFEKKRTMIVQMSLLVIFVSWSFCAGIATAPLVGVGRYKVLRTRLTCGPNYDNPIDAIVVYSRTVLVVCWIITIICYVIISTIINRYGNKYLALRSTGSQVEVAAARQRRRALTKLLSSSTQMGTTVLISIGLYTIAFILPAGYNILLHDDPDYEYGSTDFHIYATQLFILNLIFVVNPLIYSLPTKQLRNHLVEITKKFLCCRRGNDPRPKDAS
ncbi:rhodopsin-like [Oscarella lobularis]|uniref:rhodopsin-like n=1 Tax=Oscarella lobularis TaxID=121494 RepID=UPI0033134420